jgi:hypothetical protein
MKRKFEERNDNENEKNQDFKKEKYEEIKKPSYVEMTEKEIIPKKKIPISLESKNEEVYKPVFLSKEERRNLQKEEKQRQIDEKRRELEKFKKEREKKLGIVDEYKGNFLISEKEREDIKKEYLEKEKKEKIIYKKSKDK